MATPAIDARTYALNQSCGIVIALAVINLLLLLLLLLLFLLLLFAGCEFVRVLGLNLKQLFISLAFL